MSKHLLIYLLLLLHACGKENMTKSYDDPTPEQRAEKHMNDGEFNEAIDILLPLTEENPEEYFRFPLLAAAYAGLAGVDILSVLKAMLNNTEDASPLTLILNFIPDDSLEERTETLEKGIAILRQIPARLIGIDGDPDYGLSAELQLVLYQTVYATMLLRSLLDFDANGNIDIESLRNMSIEDARRVLSALGDAAVTASGDNAQQISESAQTTLDDIDAEEGADDDERLRNYLSRRSNEVSAQP